MVDLETLPNGRKLPVLAVVNRSYGYVWDHRQLLVVPTLVLFVVLIVAGYLSYQVFPPGLRLDQADPSAMTGRAGKMLLLSLASYCVIVAFVVGVHRTVLLEEIRPGLGFLRFDGNTLRYFGTILLILILSIPAILGFAFLGTFAAIIAGLAGVKTATSPTALMVPAMIALYLLLAALYLRLALALPAAALGDRNRLTLSWRATKSNAFRLLATAVLTALPIILTQMILFVPGLLIQTSKNLQSLGEPAEISSWYWIGMLAASLVKAASTPVLTTMLSLCYDVLVRGGGPAEPASAE